MEKMEKSNPNRGVKLGDYAEKIRQRLKDNYQYRTADINQCTMKSFMKFRKQKDILLCELDELVVGAYESYLKHQGLTLNTISFYMRYLQQCREGTGDSRPQTLCRCLYPNHEDE